LQNDFVSPAGVHTNTQLPPACQLGSVITCVARVGEHETDGGGDMLSPSPSAVRGLPLRHNFSGNNNNKYLRSTKSNGIKTTPTAAVAAVPPARVRRSPRTALATTIRGCSCRRPLARVAAAGEAISETASESATGGGTDAEADAKEKSLASLSCAVVGDASAAAAAAEDTEQFRFEGTRRLYGDARFFRLAEAHVVVLGMGGVGSWAVEALARSGVGALTLVDLDTVCVTNVNRQVLASDATVGQSKAGVMAARVRDINPGCDVRVIDDFVSRENVQDILGLASSSDYSRPDYVLDAIDSERDKAAVAACCVHHRVPVMVGFTS
jgi:hypothetical protein